MATCGETFLFEVSVRIPGLNLLSLLIQILAWRTP